MNDKVEENDTIQIRPSTKGSAGKLLIKEIPECNAEITVTLFGRKLLCPKLVEANGEVVSSFYEVKNGDEICTYDYYSVKGLLEFAGMDVDTLVLLNGREGGRDKGRQERDSRRERQDRRQSFGKRGFEERSIRVRERDDRKGNAKKKGK